MAIAYYSRYVLTVTVHKSLRKTEQDRKKKIKKSKGYIANDKHQIMAPDGISAPLHSESVSSLFSEAQQAPY